MAMRALRARGGQGEWMILGGVDRARDRLLVGLMVLDVVPEAQMVDVREMLMIELAVLELVCCLRRILDLLDCG